MEVNKRIVNIDDPLSIVTMTSLMFPLTCSVKFKNQANNVECSCLFGSCLLTLARNSTLG